jgi:hypothetical protein
MNTTSSTTTIIDLVGVNNDDDEGDSIENSFQKNEHKALLNKTNIASNKNKFSSIVELEGRKVKLVYLFLSRHDPHDERTVLDILIRKSCHSAQKVNVLKSSAEADGVGGNLKILAQCLGKEIPSLRCNEITNFFIFPFRSINIVSII